MDSPNYFQVVKVAVVIPCSCVEAEIEQVISGEPSYIEHIILADDTSTDKTADIVAGMAQSDLRIKLIQHQNNQGVGRAMKTGDEWTKTHPDALPGPAGAG